MVKKKIIKYLINILLNYQDVIRRNKRKIKEEKKVKITKKKMKKIKK